MSTDTDPIEDAKKLLADHGYTVVKTKSYLAAQTRQRVAEALREAADHARASTERWAHTCLDEERRLRDRLVFVYGIARAHGATQDELRGENDPGYRRCEEEGPNGQCDEDAHTAHWCNRKGNRLDPDEGDRYTEAVPRSYPRPYPPIPVPPTVPERTAARFTGPTITPEEN